MQPNDSLSVSMISSPATTSTGSDARDYAATAQMLNDIISPGSGDQSAAAGRTSTGSTGFVSGPRSGPRPVPELQSPSPAPDGPVTPDFFASSRSKKRLKWTLKG